MNDETRRGPQIKRYRPSWTEGTPHLYMEEWPLGEYVRYEDHIASTRVMNEYPECSGNPNDCPENEGYGCCNGSQKDNPNAHL
ncbi:hypothetical protein [Pseudoxanthomonas beigongshangi]